MGRKSTIRTDLPKDIEQALVQRIIEGKHTEQGLIDWLNEQGHTFTVRMMNRYVVTTRHKLHDLAALTATLSPFTIAKHTGDIESLGRLLTQRLFLDDEINALKQTIHATNNAINAPVHNNEDKDNE